MQTSSDSPLSASDAPSSNPSYGYGPLVRECQRRGISRSWGYQLAANGLLDTFLLGSKRMVWIASLESLPERLPKTNPADATAALGAE
jgi:hypothetical protein